MNNKLVLSYILNDMNSICNNYKPFINKPKQIDFLPLQSQLSEDKILELANFNSSFMLPTENVSNIYKSYEKY